MIFTHAIPLRANPQGGVVSAGQATISSNASTVHINQHTDRAVIDWRGFDIAPNERTEFQQPGSGSIALNRVNSNTASHIDGQLSANGNIVIVNQNGVVFGRGAQVDVNSLIATTSDIRNEQFMAGGKLVFDKPSNNPNAQIINEGSITAKDAGLVGLVAPRVENRGVITARLGRVHLASGDTATVDFYGDGLLEVAVSDNVSKQLVRNTGVINANGGLVAMTAAAGKNIVDSVVTSQGMIVAKSVAQRSSKVLIAGNNVSDVIIDGLIDASGLAAGQTGGAVHIIGKRIALMNASRVDVSGNAGAGEILVGGDYHGGAYRGMLTQPSTAIEWGNTSGGYSAINGSPTAAFFAAYYAGMSPTGVVPTASRVFIDKDVMMVASSDAGHAGRIITWSNNGTVFNGHADVSAKGISGNGGFIEISGKDWLSFNGTVNTHSRFASNGLLLLDPADITISNAADADITGASPFDSTGAATSNLNVTTLQNALASGSVTITSAAGAGGTGNITFTDAVAWNSSNGLTVTASNNIIVNNTITNSGSGGVTLNANIAGTGSITINDDISTGGSITALANRDITLAATKTLTTGATGAMNLQAANGAIGGTGNLTINGNLSVGNGGLTLVSGINGTRPSYTMTTTNFTQQGADLGVVSITGFQDVTVNRNLTAGGALTINPQRDFILSASRTLSTTGASMISILAQRDITTNASSVINTSAGGSLSLQAANGSTVGTGNLTLGGNISIGTGSLTLLSGINGTRPSLTLSGTSYTQLGANVGAVSLSGFQDITISTSLSSSAAMTLSPLRDFFASGSGTITSATTTINPARDFITSGTVTLSSTNAFTVLAQRDITIGAGTTITSGTAAGVSLQAANGSTAGTGNLTLNGNITTGTGNLTLLSGINGTRPSLTLSSSTLSLLGATVGSVSLTGFNDLTLSRALSLTGALTVNTARDLTLSAALSTASTMAITPGRDFIVSATGSLTSTNAGYAVAITAARDLTITAGGSIVTTATGSLNLQAAGGSIAGTGNLTVSGNLSVGSGALTLLSGINVTRPSLTLNTTTLTPLGASIGAINITGFLDVTVARNITGSGAITISPQQSFTINNSATLATTGASAITILAQRDITSAAGSTISAGTSGSIVLQAANNSIAGTGNLTIGGNLAVGSGSLTLVSGINGTRPSLTLDNTTYTQNGATVGAVSITGMLNVTVSKNMTGSSTITISPQQDFTLNNSATITTTGASAITIVALRDVTTVAGSTLSGGATGSLVVEAANNVVAGTGNLTLGGNISIGTGALTLTSGINGTRPSWTMDNTTFTQLAATVGTVTINGFQDVTVSKAITGSGSITINPQRDFILSASQTITVGGAGVFTVLAQRDITTNASSVITTGATGGVSLRAANAAIAGAGNLTLGGKINIGTGALTLLSGINGTRPSLTLNSTSLAQLGATIGAISITGFQDVTQAMNIAGSSTITISPQRDYILNASQTLSTNSASLISIVALRDITTNASSTISTGATGSLTMQAANNVVAGTGNLTLGGNLSVGTGTLTLTSGINGTRPSWTMDNTSYTQLGATVGVVTINGFQDVTVSKAVTGSGAITINPQRDFILSASQTITVGGAGVFTVLAQRDIITNASSVITTGATGGVSLRAANAVTTGTGNLTLGGKINIGTGALTLVSGINGTRPSWTMDSSSLALLGATVGTTSITGFLDATVAMNIASNGSVTIGTFRDLTLNASQTITTGSAGALSLTAANNSVAGTGNLTLNGNLSVGTGTFTLLSGINGTRPSYTMTASNFTQQGATIGTISISGFQDFTVDTDLTSSGSITLLSNRDLNINATRTITGGAAGAISIRSANGSAAGTGKMNMLGTISIGTGNLTLLSGINGTRPSLTLDNTNLIRQGATFGAINMQGFATLTLARPINTTSTVTISNNTNTALASDITSTGAMTFSNAVVIAEAATVNIASTNAAITFSSTVNGTAGGVAENLSVSSGTGTVTFTGIVGGTTALGNLSVTADNLTISANVNGTGTLTLQPVTAARIIVIGGAQADNLTTNGFNLSTSEVGRLVNGWGSIVIGNTTSGALTNTIAAWNDPVSFITGNDFASTVALTSADPIFVQAVRDVLLTQTITTTNTSANAIVLVAGRNFINTAAANPLTTGAGGRWLVYSTDPTGTTGEQTMSNAFNRYSCTYGGSCPTFPGTGNGLMYSYTPLLDVTIDPQSYNYGDAIIPPTGYTLQTSGYLNALDTSQGVVGGVGNFTTSYVQGNNAGSSFTITNNGSTFTSNLGYGFNYVSPTGLTVGQRQITVQVSDQTKVYGNAPSTSAYTLASGTFYGTDNATLALTTDATLSSSGNYNYRATPWTLSANGANFTSGLASNYNISYLAAPTGLTITQRPLTVTATGINRVYNGLTGATVTLGDNRVVGDVLTTAYSGASFGDKNVGIGKSISVTGINVTDTDSGNYTFNTTASASADITQRTLTISAAGISKVYDGLTTATATLTDDRVAGDVFNTTYTGNFADKNAGTGKTVNVTGINISTGDAANYTFNTTASTTADITQRALTISATGVNKTYNGLTTATVNFGDDRLAGDVFTINYTGNFADKNVGTTKSVSVTGINLTGTDSGNYSYSTTASTSADITQRALTISATGVNKTYNGLTTAGVTFSDDRVAGDVFTTSYGAANFANKNVGTGKAISVTGINISTGDAANYSFNTTASTTADITQRALTISATGVNKTYNGLTTANVNFTDDRVAGDVFTTSYGAANFADKNVGTGKAISITGINISTGDAANYTYNTTASASADITQRALTISATGVNKTYNGLTTAGVTFSDDRVAGDVFTTSYGAANFADKNVGTGKAISVTGLSISTGDAANYTFNTTASAGADITQRSLTISATGVNKTYNGLTTAGVTFSDDRVAGDVFTTSYGAANFADKNVGTGKAISVTGINIATGDAANYSFNTTASTSADITQRALTISATGMNKTYNGLTTAGVTFSDDRVAGDVFTTSYGAANFADKNAGTGKSISVTGINIATGDAANYTFNTTATTTADIAQRALMITAAGISKIYNGLTTATATLSDDRVAGDVFNTTYTGNFVDKNAGTGKTVNITGINISTGDAANYSFNTTASATADITQRALTISAIGVNKVYDGLTTAAANFTDDRVAGDVFNTTYTGNFADKNVGTGKAISITGINISTGDAANYTFNTTASTSANITQRSLTISATGVNKVYNGLTTAGVTFSDDRVAGDVFTTSYGAANFGDKNVGVGKAISVTGLNISTGDAANYTFNTTASASANITQRALTISVTGVNKVYNGLTTAGVTFSDDRVAGDVFTTSYSAANFVNKNVGVGKAISVTGLNISTGDAANYSFNTTASASADITQRALTISATGVNKVYNGLTTAGVTFSDDRVAGDVFTTSYSAANFGDKNVGTGKAISVTGLNISSSDAANYTFNTTASAAANITKRALLISAAGSNKVYDSLTSAVVTLSDNRVAGDVFTTSYGAANFANKNVGTAKAITVSGINIATGDAGNYSFNTTASANADITPRTLVASASGNNKVYNGSTNAIVTFTDNRISGDTIGYTYTANFVDKNVGTGKAIGVVGVGLVGTDAGNYVTGSAASTSANITPRALLISASSSNKLYDGNTGAIITLSDNRVSGDILTLSYGSATYANSAAGANKPVTVTGIGLTGIDSGNYTYNTSAFAVSNIIAVPPVGVIVPVVPVTAPDPMSLVLQLPNTVKKGVQTPLSIPEFLLFEDEWQKRHHKLPTLGMLR